MPHDIVFQELPVSAQGSQASEQQQGELFLARDHSRKFAPYYVFHEKSSGHRIPSREVGKGRDASGDDALPTLGNLTRKSRIFLILALHVSKQDFRRRALHNFHAPS